MAAKGKVARRAGAPSQSTTPASPPGEQRATGSAAQSAARRRRGWIAGLAAIVILVIAVGAFFALRGPPPVTTAAMPIAQYVGDETCASCHAREQAAWKGSDHDLAMQTADDKSVLGDFADAKFTYAGT